MSGWARGGGARIAAAATSLAGALDLRVDDAVVIHNSNKLALRLLPCDVLARVALVGQEVFALELELAQRLAAVASPIAALERRVDPRVYEVDGFAVTLWTYYEAVPADQVSPAEYADLLHRLHAGMRRVEIATPHLVERAARAVWLVANRDESPALGEPDRDLLLSTLQNARHNVHGCGAAEQLLHGEPHPGNVLGAQDGPLFIDFESCCRGPIEFDVAHLPDEASAHYPDVDQVLLEECRRLVLAMVAAWRWDVRDELPNGRQHGRDDPEQGWVRPWVGDVDACVPHGSKPARASAAVMAELTTTASSVFDHELYGISPPGSGR